MPQIATPIFSGFYQSRTLIQADLRCINLYPEMMENGKEVGALYGCPGLDSLGSIGDGPWRALRAINDGLFGVSGNTFYQISGTFAGLKLGVLGSTKSPVGIVDNGKQLLLVDGATAYGYDIGLNQFAPIALPFVAGFPVVCAYQDGFFLLNQAGTQNWWQSNLNDVFTWDPLNFSEKDGQPDNIVAIVDNHREVWLLGSQTTEVWINGGSQGVGLNFVFQRLQGVFIQEGCAAPYSAIVVGGSVIWLSKSREGQGVVLQSRGYQVARISTHAIEREIQSYAQISDALAYTYQQEGHVFYVLNFPAADTTWCFDTITGYWHQRAGFDNGEFVRHRGNCCALFQGGNIVGDFETGDLYQFNLNTYDDAGRTRKWLRSWHAFPTGQTSLKKIRLDRLQIYMEPGVGSDSPPAIRVIELPTPGFNPTVQPLLKIVKVAVGGNTSFPFTVVNAFPAAPVLTTTSGPQEQILSVLIGAIPSITETVPAGWTLTSTTVTNARLGSPPFILGTTAMQAGDDVTVTFTDTIMPAQIKIVKIAASGDAAFPFVVTNATPSSPTITTVSGTGQQVLTAAVGAIVNITETVPVGWEIVSVVATNARPGAPPFILGTTALQPDDDVTVTFSDAFLSGDLTLQSKEFTTSGTFTVPSGVTSVFVTMIGGGGGGGAPISTSLAPGSGGGAGEYCQRRTVKVTPGDNVAVVIGAGGASTYGSTNGKSGTASSFGSLSCQGGYGGCMQSITRPWISNGGGMGAGKIGDSFGNSPNGIPAAEGTFESKTFYGGSSGGGIPRNVGDILPGGTCGPFPGGPDGGVNITTGDPGGAGGGSSIFGIGGSGGGPFDTACHDGLPPLSGCYGAGGGGVGNKGNLGGHQGGQGASGYCLVEWMQG